MTAGRGRVGLVAISLAGVLWGTGGLGVQVIRDHAEMSFLTISGWRLLLAAMVLAVAVLVLRQGQAVLTLARSRPLGAVLVGAGTAGYQALYFGSVVATGVTVATVVSLGLAPVLLTIVDSARQRRRPSGARLLVLVGALSGLVMVSVAAGSGSSTGPHPVLGVLLALASSVVYAGATELGRPLAGVAGPLALTTTTTTVGAVVLVPIGLLAARGEHVLISGDPVVVTTLVYLGVFTMALAYGLFYVGLRTTTGSSAVIATLLEPVTAAVVAALFLDERLGALGVVGTLLILAAVAGLAQEEEPVAVPPPA